LFKRIDLSDMAMFKGDSGGTRIVGIRKRVGYKHKPAE
jgi:hypothetical protein